MQTLQVPDVSVVGSIPWVEVNSDCNINKYKILLSITNYMSTL